MVAARHKLDNLTVIVDCNGLQSALATICASHRFVQPIYDAARRHQDLLLGLLTQAQMRDAERHRRWVSALVQMALSVDGNRAVLESWCARWLPLGEAAIDAWCAALPEDGAGAAVRARAALRAFVASTGLGVA